MIKLKLYPPTGTIKDASALKFELSGIMSESFRVRVENATHGIMGVVTSLQDMGDGTHMGIANINLPRHLQQSAISIFAHIEEQQVDGSYRTVQICPTIFTIKNETKETSSRMVVSPSFVGQEDLCSIRFVGNPNSKKVVAINDNFFKAIINDEGLGSVSFKGSDVVGQNDIETVYQLPIYLYDEDDNFTKKVFSDHYLNILPTSLSMHTSPQVIDPRCDDSDIWETPPECIPIIIPPGPENPGIEPAIPGTGIPSTCRQGTVEINTALTCKIFSHSATLLNNGMVMHAYLSPDLSVTDSDDSLFNINKLFLAKQQTSSDVQIIANSDVVVEPKAFGEIFTIHVQEDVWTALSEVDDVYVVLFNESTSFQRIKITGRDIDPYTGSFIVTGELEGDTLVIRDWLFCVNAVFYHNSETPDLYLDVNTNPLDLSSIIINGVPVQIIDVSISSNSRYVGEYEESYVYIVVSALVHNNTQLFFNSLIIGKDSSVSIGTAGWNQLTFVGNNQNPVSKIGSDNNLHIVWESDRGGIKQMYYGSLGLSSASAICTAFSSSIDKYSDFLSRNDPPFDYLSTNLLTSIGSDRYNPSNQVPEFSSSDLVDSNWIEFGSGSVSQSSGDSYINDLTISANALTDDAMAFNSLQIVDDLDNPTDYEMFPYSQFNYQISFDMEGTVAQSSSLASDYEETIISDKEMDSIFSEWKRGFELSVDDNVENQPVYTKSSNSFVIGRVDNIFDRIVPIVGSYKHESLNPSGDSFQINITEQSNNLKDFIFGLMFEKTRFIATNIYSASEFPDNNPSGVPYISSETQTIYTGMAKLVAFIKTEDVDSDRANYIIVREFPEKINVINSKTYTIISNYTKIDSPEVTTLMDTYNQTYTDKFLGQVTLLIDSVARFSQSFISTISNEYNYFDIGFGIPYGGYYIADKMTPSKLGVFDNVSATLAFSNIEITSPTYTHNTNVINIPASIRDMTRFRVDVLNPSSPIEDDLLIFNFDRNVEEEVESSVSRQKSGEDYSELFDTSLVDEVTISFTTWGAKDGIEVTKENGTVLYDSGLIKAEGGDPLIFDIDVTFISSIYINTYIGTNPDSAYRYQVEFKGLTYNTNFAQMPITFEGINQTADMELGICNDVHLAWQSNRDKNWNIFYSSSVDKLSPFRFDTKITETESNSLRPSVSVNRNGSRMITWHDDRNGNFDIFMARATDGYTCDQDKCKKEMADAFDDNINECNIAIDYASEPGVYALSLVFYKDAALSELYTTISVDDITEGRWFVDGSQAIISYDSGGSVQGVVFNTGGDVVVSYTPDKDDDIFDIVLYVELVSTFLEEVV